jgi:regulation of enolase protein 1 (concanavalin A-like superfamily)
MVIEASGRDLWGNVDGMHYVYQYISGDCEMSAKIESIEAGHEWSKAAIMVRESLSGNSKSSSVLMANTRGARSQHRYETGGGTVGSTPHAELKAPYWLKLVRKGDTFTYFISENGAKWKKIDTQENPMPKDVYIGFAFTSHDNEELATAVFTNYRLKAKVARID